MLYHATRHMIPFVMFAQQGIIVLAGLQLNVVPTPRLLQGVTSLGHVVAFPERSACPKRWVAPVIDVLEGTTVPQWTRCCLCGVLRGRTIQRSMV